MSFNINISWPYTQFFFKFEVDVQEVLSSAGYSITSLEKAMMEVRGSRKVDSQTGDENFEVGTAASNKHHPFESYFLRWTMKKTHRRPFFLTNFGILFPWFFQTCSCCRPWTSTAATWWPTPKRGSWTRSLAGMKRSAGWSRPLRADYFEVPHFCFGGGHPKQMHPSFFKMILEYPWFMTKGSLG